jgi:predicted alpha/beta-fold hydrolase
MVALTSRGIDIAPKNHADLPEDAPTVVVAHGLTGGSHESYVRNVLAWVIKPKSEGGLGGRGVVVNVSYMMTLLMSVPWLWVVH